MMISTLLILAALGASPTAAPAAGGDEIFVGPFDDGADRDYDGWPDGWTRTTSAELPPFVRVGIVAAGQTIAESLRRQPPASENRVLRVELDGGGAVLSRSGIVVGPHYSLQLSLRVRTGGLSHDGAWATLSLLDRQGQIVQSLASQPVTGAGDWQLVEIGPIAPRSTSIASAVVSLHVAPLADREDLTGWVEFDDVSLVRLPRMTLEASAPVGLYADPKLPAIACTVSGVRIAEPIVRFELLDMEGVVRATQEMPLILPVPRSSDDPNYPATAPGDSGHAHWSPPVPDFGYYQVRASLHTPGNPTASLSRTLPLAVLRALPAGRHSEFGWSLPSQPPYGDTLLPQVLSDAGLGWAKLPVWYDVAQNAEIERAAWLAEQLSIQNIELVGVLDQPPQELRQIFREAGPLPVASVFIEPDLWRPVVSPVLTRLGLKVRWWQLGDDQDQSFVGFPGMESKLAEIKQNLEQYGQEVRIGMGWRWMNEPPTAPGQGAAPWAYLSYTADPELTADELGAYLARPAPAAPPAAPPRRYGSAARAAPGDLLTAAARSRTWSATHPKETPPPVQQWLVLSPLPRDDYAPATRVNDLVLRMLAAKMHGASAVFVPQPFDEGRGLMQADGSPGELFVPWRTTALLVGGSQYAGRIPLAGSSVCHGFVRDSTAVLAIWNDQRTSERLLLGDKPQVIDVWGRASAPPLVTGDDQTCHELAVGPTPIFVTAQSAGVVRWQAGLEFENPRLASVFDQQQTITLRVPNGFGQGISGDLRLHGPDSWTVDPRPTRFKLAEGDELKLALPVTLKGDANSGPQPVRLDFEIAADRSYRFSVHRTLQLGLEDVQIELATRLREDGALVVEQQLINSSDKPVSFQCLLFPPGRRREIRQVIQASRGRTALTFVLPKGEELIGTKLSLRAEEMGGPRVLNYTVVAER